MILFTLIGLMACNNTDKDNDDYPSQMPSCDEVETPVGATEETAMGFTPQDAADDMPISHTVGIEWEDGSLDCLHYSLQLDPASARNVASTPAPIEGNGPVPAIDVECNDYVAIDGSLSMSTPAGEIDEEIAFTLIYVQDSISGEISSGFSVYPSSLNGSYAPSNADSSSEYQFDVNVENGIISGELSMMNTSVDGDIALAEKFILAEWGHVEPPAECAENNE